MKENGGKHEYMFGGESCSARVASSGHSFPYLHYVFVAHEYEDPSGLSSLRIPSLLIAHYLLPLFFWSPRKNQKRIPFNTRLPCARNGF